MSHLNSVYLLIILKKDRIMIELHDRQFIPYISASEIDCAIAKMAEQIQNDFKDEIPVFIGVLNGSFMVLTDFLKKYKPLCEVSFITLSSYEGLNSTQNVKQIIGLNHDLTGKSVVVIEDIIDTGSTLETLFEIFSKQNLKQLKFASLFFKPEVFKKMLQVDYIGIEIPDTFIVGYGLDYNGLGRNLPEIYQLKN